MAVARHQIIEEKFLRHVRELSGVRPRDAAAAAAVSGGLTPARARQIFESQVKSRVIDIEARAMKARNEGFYTIGSSGHEGNAVVAAALAPTDLCFLHYRSGAFMMQRASQVPGSTPIFDTMLSLAASSEDPASGGRHKVWGSLALSVPPQTSTIASHLPKAVGAAFAIGRWSRAIDLAGRHAAEPAMPRDGIVVASFGDASINHSTCVGAINAALWTHYQQLPMPLLLVCEDNSLGISVRTPDDWIPAQYARRAGLVYFGADGLDLAATWAAARRAVEICRTRRVPVLLHLKMIRLMGHAGSDVEQSYRSIDEIERVEAQDPLIRGATWLVEQGWATPDDLLALYAEIADRARAASREACRRPKLETREDVMAPLAPLDADAVASEAGRAPDAAERRRVFGGTGSLPDAKPRRRHMAMHINWALHDLMVKYPEMLVFGEDVARKGGVYHVTHKLYERFGVGRVFNTLLDEQTILGVAIGAAQVGYLPCPEIQYLAYLVHAADQLRGEACSLQFFSNAVFANPMVVRVAGLAYQKGFGGHFHNDNGFGFLREIPGLIVACPSRGDDAARMLRTCFAVAKASGRVVVFLEPIALYMTKDLHERGDEEWSFPYPPPTEWTPLLAPRVYEAAGEEQLVILTYGNGVPMSLRVARRLEKEGHPCRVVDLRWLHPIDREAVRREASRGAPVLVVDEGRETGGLGRDLVAIAALSAPAGRVGSVTGADCYVPLADASSLVLVSEPDIETAARALITEGAR